MFESVTTKITVTGMMCSHCEKHMEDAIKKSFKVKKVKADHEKNLVEIVSKEALSEDALKAVVAEEGYFYGGIQN